MLEPAAGSKKGWTFAERRRSKPPLKEPPADYVCLSFSSASPVLNLRSRLEERTTAILYTQEKGTYVPTWEKLFHVRITDKNNDFHYPADVPAHCFALADSGTVDPESVHTRTVVEDELRVMA